MSRERSANETASRRPSDKSGARRAAFALGPVAAGLLLDALDLATFGPVGLWTGLLVGGAAGWLIAPSVGLTGGRRWWCAGLSGVYCMLPFTAFLPLATLLGALSQLREPPSEPPPGDGDRPAIEAEFRVHRDGD